MLKIRANYYSFEAANPRHEHEWKIWANTKLPAGKALIPGMITHCSVLVEHPELVSERIQKYARLVGRENVIAGADCGFASMPRAVVEVHPSIVWAKFEFATRRRPPRHKTSVGMSEAQSSRAGLIASADLDPLPITWVCLHSWRSNGVETPSFRSLHHASQTAILAPRDRQGQYARSDIDGNRIIAFVLFNGNEIADLFVAPAIQRQGIGKQLGFRQNQAPRWPLADDTRAEHQGAPFLRRGRLDAQADKDRPPSGLSHLLVVTGGRGNPRARAL